MFKCSFKILITKNNHLCKMWKHLMQNNSIIHFNTKMQKILFQVCKRMNFLLNCRFFYLHQSKLWGKHIHKNSRICKTSYLYHFSMVEKTSCTNAIMKLNMVCNNDVCINTSVQVWVFTFYHKKPKWTQCLSSPNTTKKRLFLIIVNEINYTETIISPSHKSNPFKVLFLGVLW
jgi:hypothetical protein